MLALALIFALFWIIGGIFAYGASFGYIQRHFPLSAKECEKGDQVWCAVFSAMAGPIFLLVVAFDTKFIHGLKWRREHD